MSNFICLSCGKRESQKTYTCDVNIICDECGAEMGIDFCSEVAERQLEKLGFTKDQFDHADRMKMKRRKMAINRLRSEGYSWKRVHEEMKKYAD